MAETIIPHTHAARQAQEFGIIYRTMPQNKSTSRIAAITGKLAVALAALLAPAILIAETTNVTFDAALTNETGWVYSDGFEYVTTKKMYGFKSGNNGKDQVVSPVFGFAITSLVIHAEKASDKTTRKMSIRTTSGSTNQAPIELVEGIVPTGQVAFTSNCYWAQSDHVRSFALLTTGGNGNLYLKSATISGVPIIEAPTDLQADDIKGTRFRLSWTNPENAVSNRIEVSEIVETETSGGSILEYDFNNFTNNSGSAKDITDDFTNSIPAFTGSTLIRLPAHTNGIIQISKYNTRGYLLHSGFADYSNMSLIVSLKIPTTDNGKSFGVSYLAEDGSTNQFAKIDMGTEFKTNTVSLASVPSYAPLVFNTDGIGINDRIVYVDYMAFTGASAGNAATNVVATLFTAGSPMTMRRLSPSTEYIVTVSAFDAEGNESSPSEPLAVTTNGEAIPFSIRIQ